MYIMDYFCYTLCTNMVIFLFLAGLIITILHCFRKHKLKVYQLCIIFICLFGIYSFMPLRFYLFSSLFKNPKHVEIATKFIINPVEKRWCYKYLAQMYKNSVYNKHVQDIDKAIYYMEKAINGNYSKYKEDTIILAHWYSLKGDWNNTIKLNNIINNTKGVSLRNAYIMNDEYQKALNVYNPHKNSLEDFLIADLYKKIKNYKEAKISLKKAQKFYDLHLNKIATQPERVQYIENAKKYKTVENYKHWLSQKCL